MYTTKLNQQKYKVETIFINWGNSKTSEHYKTELGIGEQNVLYLILLIELTYE